MSRIKFVSFIILILLICVFAEGEVAFKYDSKRRRDPFVPLISADGAYVSDAYGISGIKDIRLEGIVWDGSKGSVAIINGEIVEAGQNIGTVKVLKINKDSVVFEVDREEVKVELRSE